MHVDDRCHLRGVFNETIPLLRVHDLASNTQSPAMSGRVDQTSTLNSTPQTLNARIPGRSGKGDGGHAVRLGGVGRGEGDLAGGRPPVLCLEQSRHPGQGQP